MKNNFLSNNIKGLKVLFGARPVMMSLFVLFTAIHGISWVLQVILMQQFFDSLEYIASRNASLLPAIVSLLLMGAGYAFSQFMNGAVNCYGQICNLSVSKILHNMIFDRIGKLSILDFEDPGRLDIIDKAENGCNTFFWVSTAILDIIFFYGLYFSLIGGYMYAMKPILGISILVIFIPCIVSKWVNGMAFRKLEDVSAPIRRKVDYYERCMTGSEFCKESRILGVNKFFNDLYIRSMSGFNKAVMHTQVRKSIVDFALNVVTVVCYGAIIFMLFQAVMRKEITVGVFAAILANLERLYSFMDEVVDERFGWASENVVSIENFLDFVSEKQEDDRTEEMPQNCDIILKNVSFSYPASSEKALKNVSLTLNNGETVAIVGENGSGKSTLCRILMGLYTPKEGKVCYGKVFASKMKLTEISAVFQKYCRYKMTIRENIHISNSEKISDDVTDHTICQEAGIDFEHSFSQYNMETILGGDFEGAELSGGQWQRIAIARGLFRDNRVIVFDEPTAAIDPLEESRVYQDFVNICKGKTAVIVTHRLASAKIADRILVLKNGRIVQDGTHEQLVNEEGEYRTMYEAQRRWYVDHGKKTLS